MVLQGYLLFMEPALPPVPLEAGEEPPEDPGTAPIPWAQHFSQILTCSLMEQLSVGENPPPAGSTSFLSTCSGALGQPW